MGNNTQISMEYDGMEAASKKLQAVADEARESHAKLRAAMDAVLATLKGQAAGQILATWPPLLGGGMLVSIELEKLSGKMGLISQYVSAEDDHMAQIIFQNTAEFDLPPDVGGETGA